jgi:hypothetical protein
VLTALLLVPPHKICLCTALSSLIYPH